MATHLFHPLCLREMCRQIAPLCAAQPRTCWAGFGFLVDRRCGAAVPFAKAPTKSYGQRLPVSPPPLCFAMHGKASQKMQVDEVGKEQGADERGQADPQHGWP